MLAAAQLNAASVITNQPLSDQPDYRNNSPDASLPTTSSPQDIWRFNNRVQIMTDPDNANIIGTKSSFTDVVNLTSHTAVTSDPDYNITTTTLNSITPNFEVSDFATVAIDVDRLGASTRIDGYYTINLTTTSGTFVATSDIATLLDGSLAGNSTAMRNNVVTAWNTITWDVDPFASGGIIYNDISSLDITFHSELLGANDGTEGRSSWFNFDTNGIEYTAQTIPEPASLALLGLGGFALVARKRRS